jgi:hypothetical protein
MPHSVPIAFRIADSVSLTDPSHTTLRRHVTEDRTGQRQTVSGELSMSRLSPQYISIARGELDLRVNSMV